MIGDLVRSAKEFCRRRTILAVRYKAHVAGVSLAPQARTLRLCSLATQEDAHAFHCSCLMFADVRYVIEDWGRCTVVSRQLTLD
jgi:hypothetical protein